VTREPTSRAVGTFVLRDGRHVTLAQPRTEDGAAVASFIADHDGARADLYARARTAADGSAALVAHGPDRGPVIGFIAFAPSGELAGVVAPAFRGVGLGTLLVHEAAGRAAAMGLRTLHVDLHPGSEDIAEMLRDAGLATVWNIDYPVAHVTLDVGGERPGWATPRPAPASVRRNPPPRG